MFPSHPNPVDATTYRRAALAAVQHALAQSHGSNFAEEFVRDHHLAICRAARVSISGRSEVFILQEVQRLATSPSAA